MEQTALISIVVILGLGIFSQWFAWRIQWPSIVIMSIAGILVGPIFGLINPEEALGGLYSPLISLAVAIILFEGSSSLDFREIKGISKSVFRIVTWAALLAWIGGTLAAHFIAGLNLEISFIIAGLLVVTGPTVIIPLLRNAKLHPRVAAVLKWEGIIVDPFGPLLALFAYQVVKGISNELLSFQYLGNFFLSALFAAVLGLALGILVAVMVNRGLFPEYLKSPMILFFVLICFTLGEVVMHETGMLSVTVFGLVMGYTRKYVSSISNVGHFVENISVILTSTVFILLTASLTRTTIAEVFTLPILGFVVVMLFVVRPLSIWISTIGTELTTKEKTLIGWIAPRGVVALTVSGYFATILIEDGYADASLLTALTFALVFITVCAHGFTLGPLAKKLDLASNEPPGVLIVGASSFATALAIHLKKTGIPVLIIDSFREALHSANEEGVKTYTGEILAEHTQYEVDTTPYETILALSRDASYNMLVIQSLIPQFGYQNAFSLPVRQVSGTVEHHTTSTPMKSHLLFNEDATFPELNRKVNIGYDIKNINVKEINVTDESMLEDDVTLLCVKRGNNLIFSTLQNKITFNEDDELVILAKNDSV